MPALRRVGISYVLPMLFSLLACDRNPPLAPTFAAAKGGVTGGAPTNLTATAASSNQIWLAWQDNSTNEDGWEVYRSTTGPSGTFTLFTQYPWPNTTAGGNDGLQASTQYCYKVRAYRGVRRQVSYSSFSNVACATTPLPAPPAAPFATNATPRNSRTIDVTWMENSSRDGFRIERSLDLGATWITADTVSANAYAFSDTGRTAEQRVCYRVFAFNVGGDSPASNTDCATPPAAPTGLTATGLDGPAVSLAWMDNSMVETQYEVQRSTDGVTFSVIATGPASFATYSDGSVSENTTYWYAVRARKDGGFSDLSNIASAGTGVLTLPPAPAPNTDVYPFAIQVFWFDNSTNEDGFKIERCRGVACSAADFTLIATIRGYPSVGSLVFLHDMDVEGGTTYSYRVRAFNRAGDSAPSYVVSDTACFVEVSEDGTYVCSGF